MPPAQSEVSDMDGESWGTLYGKIYDILDATDLRYRGDVPATAERIIVTIQAHVADLRKESAREVAAGQGIGTRKPSLRCEFCGTEWPGDPCDAGDVVLCKACRDAGDLARKLLDV
jgi:hypothetical protein